MATTLLTLDETINVSLRRFDQKKLNIIIDVENLLLKSSNKSQVYICIPESVIGTYGKDLSFEKNQITVKRSYPKAQRNNWQYHKEGYEHLNTL